MLAAAFAWLAVTCAAAGEPHFAADRPLDMQHIRLDLTVDLQHQQVDAIATLTMKPLRAVSTLRLDAVDFETHSVTLGVDGQAAAPVTFADNGQAIEVELGQTLGPGREITLTVSYTVHDPIAGLHFVTPTAEEPNAPYQLWSQGEASDNRYWIPCFDHPNERQTSELVVTVDSAYRVLSNGRLLSKEPAPTAGQTVYHWRQDKPHAAYLISMVVGRFDVREDSWRDIPVTYWVPEGRASEIAPTFGRTREILDFFAERIGVPYPWDQYAQVCCHGAPGGMENTSATTFGEDVLCAPQSPLEQDSDELVSHELAHQWWGDLLTCREWAHLWLNEGFASYFEALWAEQRHGSDEFAYELYEMEQQALAADRERPVVDRNYDDPGELFDGRAYQKGAWVVHMLRGQIGDEAFWTVINRYCRTHALDTVETVDLRKIAEEVTGRSLERFFYDWTERPGHPVLNVACTWDAAGQSAGICVQQVQKSEQDKPGEAFHFPLTLEFTGDPNEPPVTVTRQIDSREVAFAVPLSQRPTMVRVDPTNAVLKEITETKGRDLWIAQLTRDPDPIGRLRAAQALTGLTPNDDPNLPTPIGRRGLATGPNVQIEELLAHALGTERFWRVQCELARLLSQFGGPVARDALLAGLNNAHPQVQRDCATALSAFRRDPAAIAALAGLVTSGSTTDATQVAAIHGYARLDPNDLLVPLQCALRRDSRDDVIRLAVLEELGARGRTDVVDAVLEWAAAGQPIECRRAALAALGQVAARTMLDESAVTRVRECLAAALRAPVPSQRAAAATALGALGDGATPSLAALRGVAADDADGSVRRAAAETLGKIAAQAGLRVELSKLLAEVAAVRAALAEVRARLRELEAQTPAHDEPH